MIQRSHCQEDQIWKSATRDPEETPELHFKPNTATGKGKFRRRQVGEIRHTSLINMRLAMERRVLGGKWLVIMIRSPASENESWCG